MKKIAVIIICLVSCIMLTGIAYASSSLTSDESAYAQTSDLEVQIVEANVLYSSPSVDFTDRDLVILSDNSTVCINIGGIYPSSIAQFEIVIKNSGTLAANMYEVIQQMNDVIDMNTGKNLGFDSCITEYINIGYKAELLDADYSTIDTLNDSNNLGSSQTTQVFDQNVFNTIEPGQYIRITVDICMMESAGNETMNKQFDFTISPLFVQN